MAQYRRKPGGTVEAEQLRWSNWEEVATLLGDALEAENPDGNFSMLGGTEASDTCGESGPTYLTLNVRTVHGDIAQVRHGDYIIAEKMAGRFYPCKPEIFEENYDEGAAPDPYVQGLTAARLILRDQANNLEKIGDMDGARQLRGASYQIGKKIRHNTEETTS